MDRNNKLKSSGINFVLVALHPEGVDRNWIHTNVRPTPKKSPSTRRAWIEIARFSMPSPKIAHVALHPEGVDRNHVLKSLLVFVV